MYIIYVIYKDVKYVDVKEEELKEKKKYVYISTHVK